MKYEIMTETIHGFHAAECRNSTWKYIMALSFHNLSISLLINHNTIRHYVLWATHSMVRYEDKVVHVHAMNTYRGYRGTPPLIINLGSSLRWFINFIWK